MERTIKSGQVAQANDENGDENITCDVIYLYLNRLMTILKRNYEMKNVRIMTVIKQV